LIPPVDEEVLFLEIKKELNEFATHDLRINLDEYKIFEIKCNEIPITALPAGAKAPEYETEFERLDPSP